MNWLAHLLICEPDVESRLGNILADIAKGESRKQLNPQIQLGIHFHQLVDHFTDTHPIFKRSKSLIGKDLSRFSGILIDIFYDHFLSIHWSSYTSTPLDEFIIDVYDSFQNYPHPLPSNLHQGLSQMIAENWLGSYGKISGMEITLARITRRLQRRHPHISLLEGINSFKQHYQQLDTDFCLFFPDLMTYASHIRLKSPHILQSNTLKSD